MASSHPSKLFLHDHPVSSYAQKVRIALREKGIPFDYATPKGLGTGQRLPDLAEANPRLEVPALVIDDDFKIFDSKVILGYLEDEYPETPLLPKDPKQRAQARMIEEVVDTQYEAINWAYGEIAWCHRAEGELAEHLISQIKYQTLTLQAWLTMRLGNAPYFSGSEFGFADLCVAPVLNRSVYYGFGPARDTALQAWHARISERESVRKTFAEMAEAAKVMEGGALARAFMEGSVARREYRDHRLEWMVKSGGIEIVMEGLRKGNIRFSWPDPAPV
ncbi:hypothetical protein D0863_14885 [Hortaea werneckii]|uniref:GST N-terminal domain-containing protein n=1 Tax=Hortaea werneckii TaxID=91943 RepID=A0A3M7CEZ1_HORWE|nr:hypothetical protein D0863_14885 [Hortaea werneckii]